MKPLLNLFVFVFISFLFNSCNNDDDNLGTPTSNYFFKAKIDGVQYSADALHVIAGITSSSSNSIDITCATSTGNFNFKLFKNGIIGIETYTVRNLEDDVSLNMSYSDFSTNSYNSIYCDCDGTLTISAISETEIQGTFSFTAKIAGQCSQPAKVFTEGSFKTKII